LEAITVRKIFKYDMGEIRIEPQYADYTLRVPAKSKVLAVGLQGSHIVLWVEQVDPGLETKLISRLFRRFWTGTPMGVRTEQNGLDYYGTVNDPVSGLVVHIFEEVEF
jgi:hypothetical protein